MKIAITWKGGSGKSTVSTLFSLWLAQMWYKVLAIDADYNMDFAAHLGLDTTSIHAMNKDVELFYNHVWVPYDCPGKQIVAALHNSSPFHVFPHDTYTASFVQKTGVSDNISCMVVWTHSQDMLFNKSCSHSYFKPLKHYLPTVSIPEKSAIVVDSVAGTDMVWYGLYLGVDAMIIAVEPTSQSINVHKQISHIAHHFWIPVYCIINKRDITKQYPDNISNFIQDHTETILWYIPVDIAIVQWNYDALATETKDAISSIIDNTIKKLPSFTQSLSRFDARWEKTESQGH